MPKHTPMYIYRYYDKEQAMADSKKNKASADLDELTQEDRRAVLEEDPAVSISARVKESGNVELDPADRFVNTEKTTPAERASFGRRTLVTNHTIAGLPSDVHQALVASSQLRRNEAMAFRDVQAVLTKYMGDEGAIPEEVRAHLKAELKELEPAAKFDETARVLLEKYV